MNIHVAAIGIDTLGKILVSFTAIMVHHRVLSEHDIDEKVFTEMKREQRVGLVGLVMIVIGSGIEILLAAGILIA